jgi:nitroreductase
MTITPQHVDQLSAREEELYGFRDAATGMWLRLLAPSRRFDLWRSYVEGARRAYQKYQVEKALHIPDATPESQTPIFAVATDDSGIVRAGLYVNGPLTTVHNAHTPREFASEPVSASVAAAWIAQALPAGVIEVKGVWVDPSSEHKAALADLMARTFVHAMRYLGVRHAYCSAAEHAASRWCNSGGRQLPGIVPAAYPDKRYRTTMLWWDVETSLELSSIEQRQLFISECGQATSRTSQYEYEIETGSLAHDPQVWRVVQIENADELARLRRDPTIEIIDTISQQRRDLARMRPTPAGAHLFEPSRWYLYPWRRQLVHILGPQGFQALRSDRNRNKITSEQQQRLRQLKVGVVGLSVGHAIAHTLALEGICGQIRLADFDEIELSNLNRIPGTVFDLGVNKAVVAARRIAEIDPYIDIRIEPAGITPESTDAFMEGLDVVIEECDSFDVKLAVRDAARRHRIPVIMETSDRGLLDIERFDLEPKRRLFHGLLGDAQPTDLMGLSTHEKVPYVLRVLEPDQLSAAMAASMAEVDETLSTWPQLGGDINLGAATVSAAVRKLGLGLPLVSGRARLDIESMLSAITEPPPAAEVSLPVDVYEPESPPEKATSAVIHAARLAPSGGNTQPWQFRYDGSSLQLHLDLSRTSTLDVAFRGSYVAIGAALFNARVAAARHGILGKVEICPNGKAEGPVARIHFGGDGDPELSTLYEAMLRRVSNRHRTRPVPLSDDVVSALQQAVWNEGAEIHLVTDRSQLHDLAEILGESDRMRFLTDHLHHEMMRELRWPNVDILDWGIDVRTLELDSSDLAKLRVARRADVMAKLAEQDLGRALGESTRNRVQDTSALAVVTGASPDIVDYVRGGQAIEHLWVKAEEHGLALQPMSPVFIYAVNDADYPSLSPRFADRLRQLQQDFMRLTGIRDRYVVLAMRIGYAPSVSARSRRLPARQTVRAL